MYVKKSTTIMGPICGYCIFENGLMAFRIENDVSIACLKCGYCFKNL
jgi:Zn ribbon nucleic-acid-binding protein